MKILLNIFFISILFIGCTTQNTIEQPYQQSSFQNDNKDITSSPIQPNKKSSTILNVFKPKKKIIILYSSNTIGHYAIEATNTSMAYMLQSNIDFEIQTIDVKDYSWESLQSGFQSAQDMDGENVIALLTSQSYEDLVDVENIDQFNIYLPLIHKNNIKKIKKNIIFGGIDYEAQFNKLLLYSNKKDTELYDNSNFGFALHSKLDSMNQSLLYAQTIDNFSADYGDLLIKNKSKLEQSTLFINTPIVKSSIILSQLRANDISPHRILSTQLNYTPLILSLTQAQDRENLIVASSISDIYDSLSEQVSILNSDIKYDWLNYSTLIGVDYFVNETKNTLRPVIDKQVQHDIKLYKTLYHSFEEIK